MTRENIAVGRWVAVIYDSTWYPGLVEDIDLDQELLTIKFMQSSGTLFIWPSKADRQVVNIDGVLCYIEEPIKVSSRLFKVQNKDKVQKMCDELTE